MEKQTTQDKIKLESLSSLQKNHASGQRKLSCLRNGIVYWPKEKNWRVVDPGSLLQDCAFWMWQQSFTPEISTTWLLKQDLHNGNANVEGGNQSHGTPPLDGSI